MAKATTTYTGLESIDRTTLLAVMDVAIKADRPLLVLGSPGISKSETVRMVAEQEGFAVVDVRVGNLPPEDLAGIAWPDEKTKQVERYMPDVIAACHKAHKDTGKPVLLFLDEINHANQASQGPLYSIVRERQAAGYRLPEGTRIMAAGNPEGTGSISEEMSRALLDRFWVVEFGGPTSEEYDAYAASTQMHAVVRAFLNEHPDMLNRFDPEDMTSPTPRAWADLSEAMKATNNLSMMLHAANGHVGVEVGQRFAAYVEMFNQLPRFEEVVSGPKEAKLPPSFAGKYMMGLTIVSKLGDFWSLEGGKYATSREDQIRDVRKNLHSNVVTYLLRLPTEVQATALASLMRLKLDIGNNVHADSLVTTMLSDFRAASPENAEVYAELSARFVEIEKSLRAIKI